MADIALGGLERIFEAGLAIKKAVQTARRNKKECRDIERTVARIGALLLFLNQVPDGQRRADQTANKQRRGPSGGFRAMFTKFSKFTWPRARRSVSRPPPPLHVEHTSNTAPDASEGPRSHLFSAPSTSTAVGAASPPAHDELAAVEAGCVLEDYVGIFDGPMPPAVIASLAGPLFHDDDEGTTI